MPKLKFKEPYAEGIDGYRQGHTYDFVDARKAQFFVDRGLAVPVEQAGPPPRKPSKTPAKSSR
jgi:hypothetical protein